MTTEILWLSPTDFVTGDKSLTISYPSVTHPAVEIKATAPGDLKWVSMGLKIPPFHEIGAIHVCYQLSNSRSFISQIRLSEMKTPDQALVRHDDGTDLLSTTATCYRSQLATSYRPSGAVLLELHLNFGDPADTITLGASGVEILPCVPVASYTRATLPSPGKPGCLARVTDSVRGLWMDQGSQWFSLSGELANVKEFGAKGDGITDDQPAFAAAMISLSPSDSSKGGVVLVPPGTYRFATTLHIKKSIVIQGTIGTFGGTYAGCVIQPDMGITPFIIERLNTPDLVNRTAGDETVIERLTIYPKQKPPAWTPNTQYTIGDRVKVGSGNGENWAKHYECITSGRSDASGLGPTGFGADIIDDQVHWKYIGGGHGIKLRARATIRDVSVLNCSGNGIHIEAQDPELPNADPSVNANGWRLDNVNVGDCEGHGYYVNGSDAQGGVAIGGSLLANGQSAGNYAIYESSFLGNVYVGCLMEVNGNAVFADNAGGGSVFLGCYLEGGFGDGMILRNSAIVIGGGLAAGRYLDPATMSPVVLQYKGRMCRGLQFEVGGPSDQNAITTIGSSQGISQFAFRRAGKDYAVSDGLVCRFGDFGNCSDVYGWTHSTHDDRTGVMTAGGHTILKHWPMQPPLGRALFEEFYVGQSRHATSISTASPASGTWNPGDRIYFIGAACKAGSPEGKVCVNPGTAGTFTDTVTVIAINNSTNTVRLSDVPAGTGGSRLPIEPGDKSLRVGMVVTINGTTRRIIDMADDFLSMTVDGPIAGDVPATIAYSAPVFREFGSIAL